MNYIIEMVKLLQRICCAQLNIHIKYKWLGRAAEFLIVVFFLLLMESKSLDPSRALFCCITQFDYENNRHYITFTHGQKYDRNKNVNSNLIIHDQLIPTILKMCKEFCGLRWSHIKGLY